MKKPFLGTMPCTTKLEHRKSEPARTQDPENGRWFDRITCIDCGKWLSDRQLVAEAVAA